VIKRSASGGLPELALSACAQALALVLACASISAHADTRDDITRQALLRGYTTQEAQARYDALQRSSQPNQAGVAMAAGLSGLAAAAQKRMDAQKSQDDAMFNAVEAGLDYPIKTTGERDAMRSMLERNALADDYNFATRRRLIELALHARRYGQEMFERRDPLYAARLLRMNAYDNDGYGPWSALTLAKLYLADGQIPRDETEAARLVEECAQGKRTKLVGNHTPDVIGCNLLLSDMYRNGWAFERDTAKADAVLQGAHDLYRVHFKGSATDEQLRAWFR
jgi:hypothetical protein